MSAIAAAEPTGAPRYGSPHSRCSFAPRSTLTAEGYPVDNGTSFVMALAYGDKGPDAWSMLTYGNSGDPAAPVFTSATQAFSDKAWKHVAFAESDIAAATESSETVRGS